jgi:hypothetical protein
MIRASSLPSSANWLNSRAICGKLPTICELLALLIDSPKRPAQYHFIENHSHYHLRRPSCPFPAPVVQAGATVAAASSDDLGYYADSLYRTSTPLP